MVYPYAIWMYGPVLGGGCMALLATLICLVLTIVYEKGGKDLFGAAEFEQMKKAGLTKIRKIDRRSKHSMFWFITKIVLFPASRTFLVSLWLIKKNPFLEVVGLSLNLDPFQTMVLLRRGRFNGLHKKDWIIFFTSAAISQGYWIIRNWLLVLIIQGIWNLYNMIYQLVGQ